MRLIDADELKLKIVEEGQQSKRYKVGDFWELNRDEIWRAIDDLPTIEERKTGKWNTDKESPEYATCSVCGHCDWDCTESKYFNYCPNCGADMRGEQDG